MINAGAIVVTSMLKPELKSWDRFDYVSLNWNKHNKIFIFFRFLNKFADLQAIKNSHLTTQHMYRKKRLAIRIKQLFTTSSRIMFVKFIKSPDIFLVLSKQWSRFEWDFGTLFSTLFNSNRHRNTCNNGGNIGKRGRWSLE